jgi:hypothetical protein
MYLPQQEYWFLQSMSQHDLQMLLRVLMHLTVEVMQPQSEHRGSVRCNTS